MLCFNMLYKIAHFLRDQMPWLWDLVDTVNSMVFRIKYGNKLETIENDICRKEYLKNLLVDGCFRGSS